MEDSEHTIDSDIGVTGDEETVPVEKPESSDNIEAEEVTFAAVHNYLTCELAERYPKTYSKERKRSFEEKPKGPLLMM